MFYSNYDSVELISNLKLAKNKESCFKLLEQMEDISEEVYLAGWLMDLEFI